MPGSQVQSLKLPPAKFWLDPYIPQGETITLVHGKFGTFKTPILSNVAKAITIGQDVLSCKTQRGRVLFVQADTPKQVIVPRLQTLGVDVDSLDFAFCYPGFDIVQPDQEGELSAFFYQLLQKIHREKKYDVVFIDSLRAIHRLDDKEATSVHTVYRACFKLFYGASIVLIHHDKKFNKESSRDETFSGSQAWANHATVTLKFSHVDQESRVVQIEHMKTQASELVEPVRVSMAQDGVSMLGGALAEPKALEDFLRGCVAQGMETQTLENQVQEYFGLNPRQTRKKREELGL